jgi:hypothetical protein
MKRTTRVIPTSIRISPKTREYCFKNGLSFKTLSDLAPDWREETIALRASRDLWKSGCDERDKRIFKLMDENADLLKFKTRRLEEIRAEQVKKK